MIARTKRAHIRRAGRAVSAIDLVCGSDFYYHLQMSPTLSDIQQHCQAGVKLRSEPKFD